MFRLISFTGVSIFLSGLLTILFMEIRSYNETLSKEEDLSSDEEFSDDN